MSVCVCLPKPSQAGMKNEEALKEPGVQNIDTHTHTHSPTVSNSWVRSGVALVLRDKATGVKKLCTFSIETT